LAATELFHNFAIGQLALNETAGCADGGRCQAEAALSDILGTFSTGLV